MLNRFEEFTFLINKINKNINKIKAKEFKKYLLNGSDMDFIYYLGKYKKLNFKEFCKYLNHDKGYISRSINNLKNKKIIEEIIENKKNIYILSKKGNEIYIKSIEKTEEICKQIYLSDDKKDIFYKNLKEISDKLEKIIDGIKL